MKHYVYTAKAEQRAKELGFDDRKEGMIATCGHDPVSGTIAQVWLNKGYIKEVKNFSIN